MTIYLCAKHYSHFFPTLLFIWSSESLSIRSSCLIRLIKKSIHPWQPKQIKPHLRVKLDSIINFWWDRPGGGGILKFGFDRDTRLRRCIIWKWSHTNTNFQEKVTHSYTNRLTFGPNFEQNRRNFPKFFLNLAQIWVNIEKNDPFLYQ